MNFLNMKSGLFDRAMPAVLAKNALGRIGQLTRSVRVGVALDSDRMVLAVVSVPLDGSATLKGIVSFPVQSVSRESIEHLLLEHDAQAAPVAVALPGNRCFLKIIEVPPADGDTTKTLMRFEMEKHIPLPLPEVQSGFQTVRSDEQAQRIAFSAIRPADLDAVLQPLRELGILPVIALPAPYALVNAIRTSPAEESFSLKKALWKDSERGEIPPGVLRVAFASECWEMTVERGLCTGVQRCTTETDSSTVLCNEASLSTEQLVFAGQMKSASGYSAMELAAVGAALVSADASGMTINLLAANGSAAGFSSPFMRRFPQMAAGIAVTLLLLLAGYTWWMDSSALATLEQAMDAKKTELAAVEKNLSLLKEAEEQIAAIQGFRSNRLNMLGILAELSRAVPQEAWVTMLSYQPAAEPHKGDSRVLGELALAGYAKSSARLIGAIEDSPVFEGTEFTGSVTKSKQGEGFRIKTQLVRPAPAAIPQEKP